MTWIIDIFLIIILLNTIAAIITVFHRQRSIPATQKGKNKKTYNR